MLMRDIIMAAATQGGGAAAAPSELFPDPTLADVTDSTDGWGYSYGFPEFGPEGGTGPGLQLDSSFDDATAQLVGADDAALAAAITNGNTYSVSLTFANVSVSGTMRISLGAAISPVDFVAANGVVSHNVTAGDPGGGNAWLMSNMTNGATYDITAISVT